MNGIAVLVLLPVLGALGAAAHRDEAYRTVWLVVISWLHLVLTAMAWSGQVRPALGGWLALDAIGLIVLTLVSLLVAMASVHAVGYLRRASSPRGGRAFVSCLLAFLAAASLVSLSHHFALLWVGLEAMTLAVAPLIFHHHDRRSLEAVWKYLMLSSVGVALALLGVFLLAAAQSAGVDTGRPLMLEDLVSAAPRLDPAWLKAACIFLLVGFGTKMGVVPLHAWKPDTYGEAPSLVAGLMAGALTTSAFLGLSRMMQVAVAAGQGPFVAPVLLAFGLVSLVVSAGFLLAQRDFKRLLAWSSIEHMGLVMLGLGLAGSGVYGSLLHGVNNGLAKGLLFFTAGNLAVARAPGDGSPRGILRRLPVSGVLLVVGLFAVTGSPPFGTFLSMFAIVRGAFDGGHPWIGAVTLACLALAFLGMARFIVNLVYGPAPAGAPVRESGWLVTGPVVLAVMVLVLGIWIPPWLAQRLADASAALGGHAP